jgi:hypothetical protein
VVVGLAMRVTLMSLLVPFRRTVMVTLSPTLRSRTWATRDRDPSMELPSTAVIASPVWSPAWSAGVPETTLVSSVGHDAVFGGDPEVGVGGFAGGDELVGD